MGNKIGVRWTIIVSLFFKYISYALLLFYPNYYVVLISMCIFGIGSGLGNLTYVKNCWKYFPKSQGLVNGIILGGAGLSSSILTPLADYWIINPKRKETKEKGLYEKDVADNLVTYLYILCGIFAILGVLSFFITFEYKEESLDNLEEPIKNDQNKTSGNSAPLLETFLSKKNLMMISFCFCGFCKNK